MPTTSFLYEQMSITIGVILNLVAKNKRLINVALLRHAFIMLRHDLNFPFLHRLDMLRHVGLWILAGMHLMLQHEESMPRHALLLCLDLLFLIPFFLQYAHSLIFYLEYHL